MRSTLLLCGSFVMSLMRTGAQSCCSSDADCVALANDAQLDYLELYDKGLVCDQDCPGSVNCNMFGLCSQCRGCFESCEGALAYMEEAMALEDSINFCPSSGVTGLDECYSLSSSAAGTGSGSGGVSSAYGYGEGGAGGALNGTDSGSGSGGFSSASGSGSGSGGLGSASGSGSGSGGLGSASGSGSGSGGLGSASGSGSGSGGLGSASGSGSGSGGIATGNGTDSGSAGMSSGTSFDSGSTGPDIDDVPGCTCTNSEVEEGQADFLCTSSKSLYCDAECLPGSDPLDRLFYDMGGLWCQPYDMEGCRLCSFECASFPDEYCVPCPDGVTDYCTP